MIVTGSDEPAEVLATLRHGDAVVNPTRRYDQAHLPWSVQRNDPPELRTMSLGAQVYGLYGKSEPVQRWIDPSVRDLISLYPHTLGDGGIPLGWQTFTVPPADETEDPWVLLYAGLSKARGEDNSPRIQDYLGTGQGFSSAFGQSLQAELALLFGGTIDSRYGASDPAARAINRRITKVLSSRLTERFTEMEFSYVCVECDQPLIGPNEQALIASRHVLPMAPTGRQWPEGARPLVNANF